MNKNTMIEFDAEVQDGHIKVPEAFRDQISHQVHVSIQAKDTRHLKLSNYVPDPIQKDFLTIPSRDELHER